MSDKHFACLQRPELQACLDVDVKLLGDLMKHHVFSSVDHDHVTSFTQFPDRVSETIMILQRKADSAFEMFKAALVQCGQSHVADVLNGDNSTMMSTEHRELLTDKFSMLCDFLDSGGGLVESLFSSHVLSMYDLQHIESVPDYTSKAKTTITLLLRKPDSAFDIFIETLKSTGQEHVVYILTGEGIKLPLTERSLKILKDKSEFLCDLEPIEALTVLVGRGVFCPRDEERVTAKETSYDQCKELYRLLSRKSEDAFEEFIAALIKTRQLHLAIKLVGHELNGEVRVSFMDENANRSEVEEQLVIRMQNLIHQGDCTEAEGKLRKALGCNGVHVSYVRSGSISIQFRCDDLESLASFRQLYGSKELDRLFSEAFCSFFVVEGLTAIHLDIKPEEFDRCSKVLLEQQVMSPLHRLLLNLASGHCLEKILVTEELLLMLSISKRQMQAIMAEKKLHSQVHMLLDALSRRPDAAFQQFIDALVQTKQNDVVRFLSGSEASDVEVDVGNITSEMLLLADDKYNEELKETEQLSLSSETLEKDFVDPVTHMTDTSECTTALPLPDTDSQPSSRHLALLSECNLQLKACESELRKLMQSRLFGTQLSEWMQQPPKLKQQLKVLSSLVKELSIEGGLYKDVIERRKHFSELVELLVKTDEEIAFMNRQIDDKKDHLVETVENSMAMQVQLQTANQVLKTLEQKVEEGKEREQKLLMQCKQTAEVEKQLLQQFEEDNLRLNALRTVAAERTENVNLLLQRLQVDDEERDAELIGRLKEAAEKEKLALEQIQLEKEENLRQNELLRQYNAREQDLLEQLKCAKDREVRSKVLLEKAGEKDNRLRQKLRDLQLLLLSCTVTVKDSGLVDRLRQDSIVSEREWTRIRGQNCDDVIDDDHFVTHMQVNERLMDLISTKFPQELDSFLNALDLSGQKQLADVIRGHSAARLPYRQDPQLLHCFKAYNTTEHDRMAVTYLNGKLYAACSPQSNSIMVLSILSSSDLSLQKVVNVAGLTVMYDIVASSETNRIYILDSDCVWSVDENGEMPTREKLPTSLEASSLSVTADRLLLVGRNRLLVLQLDIANVAAVLKFVKLPLYMKAIHAVETKHRSFIVCHTSMLGDCADPKILEFIDKFYNVGPINLCRERITEVDTKGRVLRFCGELLSNPTYLTLDAVGRVFVADGDRVLLLDSQLQLQRVLLSRNVGNCREEDKNNTAEDKEIMILPEQICYLPERDCLILVNTTGVVSLHSFTPGN